MGVHHGFTNHGPAQAKLLVFFSPSGSQDEYFRELVRLFNDGDPIPDELKAVRKRYDQELADSPQYPSGTGRYGLRTPII